MAHWHDFNPWATNLIYLPSLEDAESICNSDKERWLEKSRTHGSPGKLDAYLLRDGPLSKATREMHLGIRWGREGNEYFSPYITNQKLALELFLKYGGPTE